MAEAPAVKPVFVADPACIRFPVSNIGTVLRQFVRVINVGPHSARLGVPYTSGENPSITPSVHIKQGYIASGLHQDVEIKCCPESFDVMHSHVLLDGEVCFYMPSLWLSAAPKPDDLHPSFAQPCRR